MPGSGSSVTNVQPLTSHWPAPTQAMWWESGLSDSRTASGPSDQSRARSRALASSVLAECITHFGLPVVPEVKAT